MYVYLASYRILGWHDNKELDGIEDSLNNKEKKEPHCAKCEHLGRSIYFLLSLGTKCANFQAFTPVSSRQ